MKYELIKLTKDHKFYRSGVNYRIKALKDFNDVKKGDLGGYVANENNLSHFGNCWLYNNARMYDNAELHDNAEMYGVTRMFNNTRMFNDTRMYDNAEMHDNARMHDNTRMFNNAEMYGYANIRGNYKLTTKLYYPKLYRYVSYPIFERDGKKPTHIRMGCFTRTIKEWQEDFYNNNEEFPKGVPQTKQRLYAINYILDTLGEERIKE